MVSTSTASCKGSQLLKMAAFHRALRTRRNSTGLGGVRNRPIRFYNARRETFGPLPGACTYSDRLKLERNSTWQKQRFCNFRETFLRSGEA